MLAATQGMASVTNAQAQMWCVKVAHVSRVHVNMANASLGMQTLSRASARTGGKGTCAKKTSTNAQIILAQMTRLVSTDCNRLHVRVWLVLRAQHVMQTWTSAHLLLAETVRAQTTWMPIIATARGPGMREKIAP